MSEVERLLAAEIARHKSAAYRLGDDPKREGVIRDGGYRCTCGSVYGVREFVPTGRRREREPRPFGPTKEQHLVAALAEALAPLIAEREEMAYERGHILGYEKGLMDPGSAWMNARRED